MGLSRYIVKSTPYGRRVVRKLRELEKKHATLKKETSKTKKALAESLKQNFRLQKQRQQLIDQISVLEEPKKLFK